MRVKKCNKIKKGEVLGIMGNTAYYKGIHYHYEVRINNQKVDPLKYTYLEEKNILNESTSKEYKILREIKEEKKDNIKFEYICHKTGYYKIRLIENEKILII